MPCVIPLIKCKTVERLHAYFYENILTFRYTRLIQNILLYKNSKMHMEFKILFTGIYELRIYNLLTLI